MNELPEYASTLPNRANWPQWLREWDELALPEKIAYRTTVDDQNEALRILQLTGFEPEDLYRTKVGEHRFVWIKSLAFGFEVDAEDMVALDIEGRELGRTEIRRLETDSLRVRFVTLIGNVARNAELNAEKRRLAALPKYIERRPSWERTESLIDWVNMNAADGYVLDKYISDGEGYIYAVMIREG